MQKPSNTLEQPSLVVERDLNSGYRFQDFWDLSPPQRSNTLLEAVGHVHAWHMPRNKAYNRMVTGRGVGAEIDRTELTRLLRPTSQTFKSYIDILGTPFPQDKPVAFMHWLADQLSEDLPVERFESFRPHYSSLEQFLLEIERIYHDYGFEILTSSGTSGRATIMVRNQAGISQTAESFYLCFQRFMGMRADHRAIFIMPEDTRIAMARMASFSFKHVGLTEDRLHYTIPFPAHPDQVRIRAGRTFRDGWRGLVERRLMHPFINWANENLATQRTIKQTLSLLEKAETIREKVLIFGGWIHLHAIALALLAEKTVIHLSDGSLIGSGGGFKDIYPVGPQTILEDLAKVIKLEGGEPAPLRDVYGMAEGNWAAMQCRQGNYHLPPWIYAAVLDENDRFHESPESTGLLAFFDPVGGGGLFPAFFKTADQVRLVNGSRSYDPALDCPCGETGAYLAQNSIQRVDLIDEAGCAAQI